jgi:hypothetical protein
MIPKNGGCRDGKYTLVVMKYGKLVDLVGVLLNVKVSIRPTI